MARTIYGSDALPLDLLAIAAHPDDVEQTCGGTLLRAAEQGYRVGVLDLTAGEMGSRGTPDVRLREAAVAAELLMLAWRGNLGLPDARVEASWEAKCALAAVIRRLRPEVVILPYWEARHPDHYRASELGFEGCFLAGLRRLELGAEACRPSTVIYSASYAYIRPSFVVDITQQFERRMQALLAYRSQYADQPEASELFPTEEELRRRLEAVARFYGQMIGVEYGEPFVIKEVMRVDDVMKLGVPTF